MKKLVLSCAIALVLGNNAFASDVKVVGTIPQVIESHAPHAIANDGQPVPPNLVSLMKVKLSNNAKQALAQRLASLKNPRPKIKSFAPKSDYPESVDLGMNNTPVLNQGMHGSCVTFANSGALDALMGQGDYVSELCSLTLGKYLEEEADEQGNEEYPSGWEGSWGPIVLKQFFKYGVVSMSDQKSHGCGGLYDYPTYSSKEGKTMSPTAYGELSEAIEDRYEWVPILDLNDTFKKKHFADDVVNDVKAALNDNNRVTFGVLLDVNVGDVGAKGTYKMRNDTWMLTPQIERDAKNDNINAGHEMVIIGYDDNVVVKDRQGHSNTGVFILRNSWGTFAGDHGNYYMTYDHFKLLTLEAQVLKAKS